MIITFYGNKSYVKEARISRLHTGGLVFDIFCSHNDYYIYKSIISEDIIKQVDSENQPIPNHKVFIVTSEMDSGLFPDELINFKRPPDVSCQVLYVAENDEENRLLEIYDTLYSRYENNHYQAIALPNILLTTSI